MPLTVSAHCSQVDDIGEVTITNDGATILQQLEVEHPAAKVLVELADLQVRSLCGWSCIRACRIRA